MPIVKGQRRLHRFGHPSQAAPSYVQVAIYETLTGYVAKGAASLPDMILDGVVLYGVGFCINWVRDELKKDDPVAQLFAGRLNTSLNLILPGNTLGLR